MQLSLIVASTPLEHRRDVASIIRVRAGEAQTIGRMAAPQFAWDSQMSSNHFEVAFDGEAGRLRDLDSSNGTMLNRLRIREGEIKHGDRIRAGQTVFRVRFDGEIAAAEQAVASQAASDSKDVAIAALSAAAATAQPEQQEWMTLVNAGHFSFAPLHGRMGFPKHSLTFIVKGTFQMKRGGVAAPLEQSSPVTGELPYPDDDRGDGSHRYPNDFVQFKPKADLLLVGKCYPPGQKPVNRCRVVFRVGELEKALEVFGNREWQSGLINDSPGKAEPFNVVEVQYEHAFGGSEYGKNPVGKGAAVIVLDNGKKVRPLPNIEDPTSLIRSPASKPDPAGFGPIGPLWEQRVSKLGTYDDRWLKTRWPWFAEDFDFEYFNVAPSDMRLDGYLRGDETICVENMHPQHERYECRLPGVRARCFVARRTDEDNGDEQFSETPLKLDTLWVDMEAEVVELVWRGVAEVRSPECREIRRVFICSEPLHSPPAPLEECERRFRAQMDAELEAEEAIVEVVRPAAPDLEEVDVDQLIADANEEIRASMHAAGMTYEQPTSEATPESIAEEARILKELGIETDPLEPAEPPMTRERIAARAAAGESFADEDLSGIDLSGLSLRGVDLSGAILSGVNCEGTDFSGANLAGAAMPGTNLTGARLDRAALVGVDLTGAVLVEADMSNAVLDDAVLDQATIARANLQGVQAVAATFVQCDLTGADASQGQFDAADFSESLLDHASFQRANLVEASVAGAIGFQADFTEANLTNMRADDAVLSQARFRQANAVDSVWEGANLEAADFAHAELDAAVFVGATLRTAILSASRLRSAQLTDADLRDARLDHADLFEAQLDGTQLQGADCSGASLYGAELTGSQRGAAKLGRANLTMSSLATMPE